MEAGRALAVFMVQDSASGMTDWLLVTEEFCCEQRFRRGRFAFISGRGNAMGKREGSRLAGRSYVVPASRDRAEDPADLVEPRDPIAQSARSEPRILLAVSGQRVSSLALYMAMESIRQIGRGVDVLVYSCGVALPPLLTDFLNHLKREGIAHRLIRRPGALATEIMAYARGRENLALALIDNMKNWERDAADRRPWRGLGVPVSALSAW